MIVEDAIRLGTVHFSPRARTAWHAHAHGQYLHVTEGIDVLQTRDGEAVTMHPGDTVVCPPGEWHWHGALDHFMTRLAISETDVDTSTLDVDWDQQVTDSEYENAARMCNNSGSCR
jgi:quercetin dioxygenase-like cupin family protein